MVRLRKSFAFALIFSSTILLYQNCGDVNLLGGSSVVDVIVQETTTTVRTTPTRNPPPTGSSVGVVNNQSLRCNESGEDGPCYAQLDDNDGCFNLGWRHYTVSIPGQSAYSYAPIVQYMPQNNIYSVPMNVSSFRRFTSTFTPGNSISLFVWISDYPGDFLGTIAPFYSNGLCYGSVEERNGRQFSWTNQNNLQPIFSGQQMPCYLEPGRTYYLNFTQNWLDPNYEIDRSLTSPFLPLVGSLNPLDPAQNMVLRENRMGVVGSPMFVADIQCSASGPRHDGREF